MNYALFGFLAKKIGDTVNDKALPYITLENLAKGLSIAIRSPEFAEIYSQITPDSHGENGATTKFEDQIMLDQNKLTTSISGILTVLTAIASANSAATQQQLQQLQTHSTALDTEFSNLNTQEQSDVQALQDAFSKLNDGLTAIGTGTATGGTGTGTATGAVPTVSSVSPANGAIAGGDTITINGSGFTGATGVSIGSVAAASFSVTNDTTISAVTPALVAGVSDVTVTAPAGTSATSAADQFTAS